MGRYVFQRLLHSIPVLFFTSVIVFLAMRLIPGDPINALFPPEASITEEAKEGLRHRFGLDQPLALQYFYWLGRTVRGDFGISIVSRRPVEGLIREKWPKTAALALTSLLIGVIIAVPLGVVAAVWRGRRWDLLTTTLAMAGISMPAFALGLLLILIFSVHLHWLPSLGNLILPAVTQGIGIAAILVRTVRSDMIHQLDSDYVRTARAKGLKERYLLGRHVLRNALIGTVTMIGWVLGYQLGGAIVVEQVFTWPGIGLLTVQGIYNRDYPIVQATVLVIAFSYVVVNLLVDLTYAVLDPRVRYS